MDDFGVLTERYGLRPQGKSAPMASSKRSTNPSNAQSWNFASSAGLNEKPAPYSSNSSWNTKSGNGSLFNGDDLLFKSNSTGRNTVGSGGFDDLGVFGDSNKFSSNKSGNGTPYFNDDLMFSNLGNSGTKTSSMNGYVDDDIFGRMPGVKSSVTIDNDNIFGTCPSSAKRNASVDDLLGDFGGFGPKSTSWTQSDSGDLGKNAADFDELIPGFGGSGQPSSRTTKSTIAAEDPFVVLESASASGHSSSGVFVDPLEELSNLGSSKGTKPWGSKLKPPPKPTQKVDEVKSSGISSIDELEDFAMGRVQHSSSTSHNAGKYKEAEDAGTKKQQNGVDDLDSFFSAMPRSSSVPKSRTTTESFGKGAPNVAKRTPNGVSSRAKKAAAPANLVDDFSSLFGDPLFGEFEEVPGESEERRRARLDHHQRTKNRVAQAVADMNHRDRQTQLEQEEKRRIAESLDAKIKRWATGKEGNMRALLSSLQNALWPECGWEPVSLTDLITSTAVKKVYRKATLFVHPDKVQQKGATLEQKYMAEKVFDILKEAWNKFNKEELS